MDLNLTTYNIFLQMLEENVGMGGLDPPWNIENSGYPEKKQKNWASAKKKNTEGLKWTDRQMNGRRKRG